MRLLFLFGHPGPAVKLAVASPVFVGSVGLETVCFLNFFYPHPRTRFIEFGERGRKINGVPPICTSTEG